MATPRGITLRRGLDRGSIGKTLPFALTVVGALLWLAYIASLGEGEPVDLWAYYAASYDGAAEGVNGSYLYSPAFAQVTEPLRALGWPAFRDGWRLLELGALVILAGPLSGPLLFLWPVSTEINIGNIHLLMALAIVAGFRYPAAWAFILLTKVTPGIGLLWFVVRREWRNLGIALGATAGIVAVSVILAPGLWGDWLRLLAGSSSDVDAEVVVTAPLPLRLAAAGVIVVWAARTDRRWGVLVAAFVALPVTWVTALSLFVGLLALVPLLRLGRPEVSTERPYPIHTT
jgi:hypothetical protein